MRNYSKQYANIFIILLTLSVWVYISLLYPKKPRILFIPKNYNDYSIQKEIFSELGYKLTVDTYNADFIYLADESFKENVKGAKNNCTINFLPGSEILTNKKSLFTEFSSFNTEDGRVNANIFQPI